jgi:hypothetical protein
VAYRPDAPKLVGSFSQALALRRRDKGKPAARRARKAYGPPRASLWEVAGLSNGDGGGATKRAPPLWEGGGRGCQPTTTTGDDHPDLTLRRQNLTGGAN